MSVASDGDARFLFRLVLAAWLREYGGGSGGLSDAEFSRRLAALPHGSEVDAHKLRAFLRRLPSGCPPRGDGLVTRPRLRGRGSAGASGCPPRGDGLVTTEGDSGAANGPNGDDGSQTP